MACEDIQAKLNSLKQKKTQIAVDLKEFGTHLNPQIRARFDRQIAETDAAIAAAEKELHDCLNPPSNGKAQPAHILTTNYHNPPFDTSDPNWASKLVGGKTFPIDTAYEWVQIYNPSQKYPDGDVDADIVGISGWAVHPELSDVDMWFAHPFGFDWEFYVAPDSQYESLLAPSNRQSDDKSYNTARQDAANLGLAVPGVLGVETDRGLVPEPYRAQEGDRVAVFGRWIVDAGHSDFHSEIHPPLLLVTARVPASRSATETRIISRPYLVGQQYTGDDEPLYGHMQRELAKVEAVVLSTQLEAHPKITPKPFGGVHLVSYTVKPPAPAASPLDRLQVSFHFTVRSGVVVQVTGNADSVTVLISLNEVTYVAPPRPPKHDLRVSLEQLSKANQTVDTVVDWLNFLNTLLNPYAAIVENAGGVLTDIYDAPRAPDAPASEMTTLLVSALPGNTPVKLDDSQPFPVYGFLSVQWVPLQLHVEGVDRKMA